jgi:hypothetical protein
MEPSHDIYNRLPNQQYLVNKLFCSKCDCVLKELIIETSQTIHYLDIYEYVAIKLPIYTDYPSYDGTPIELHEIVDSPELFDYQVSDNILKCKIDFINKLPFNYEFTEKYINIKPYYRPKPTVNYTEMRILSGMSTKEINTEEIKSVKKQSDFLCTDCAPIYAEFYYELIDTHHSINYIV